MDAHQKKTFRQWVQHTFVPCVLTLTTEEVERQCYKNNLCFSELLSPFGILQNIAVPIRTVQHSYSLRDFRLRFVPSSEVTKVDMNTAEEHLHHTILNCTPGESPSDAFFNGPSCVEDVPSFIKRMSSKKEGDDLPYPWYAKYRKELHRTLQHSEYQMIDHPVACLIVVSTQNEQPLACFEQLCSPHHLPPAFSTGQYDATVAKFYVLLHDKSEGNKVNCDPMQVLAQMKSKLSADSCFLLEINSLNEDNVNLNQPDIWSEHMQLRYYPQQLNFVSNHHKVYGCQLSLDDLKNLQNFIQELALKGILRDMERRMFALNTQVTAVRKGIRNTFKYMWRKPKDKTQQQRSSSENHVQYTYDSIESQIRMLGDLAFMVQDYEMALASYRLVREDYKSDKALLHLGSTLEMMALCLFMNEGSRRQLIGYLEAASDCYVEAYSAEKLEYGSSQEKQVKWSTRYCTHATMLIVEILKCVAISGSEDGAEALTRAASWLWRASVNESKLCVALLLEQAGILTVAQGTVPNATLPSMLRRFGFRTVMAGSLYQQCQHIQHAARCYATVKNLYSLSYWNHINNHLDLTLGRWVLSLGDSNMGIKLWGSVLSTGKQPTYKQATLLHDFEVAIKKQQQEQSSNEAKTTKSKPWRFLLPAVADADIQVHVQHNASMLPPEPHAFTDLLEENEIVHAVTGDASIVDTTLLSAHVSILKEEEDAWVALQNKTQAVINRLNNKNTYVPKGSKSVIPQPRVWHVAEPMFVDIPVRNPVALPLHLENVQLIAQLIEENSTEETKDEDKFDVSTLNIALDPNEKRVLRLRIVPKRVGRLQVIGMKWKLFGCDIEHEFILKGPLLNDTRAHRANRARAIDVRLQANVVPSSPWLGVELRDVPEELAVGQVWRSELEFINRGSVVCTGRIYVRCNIAGICFASSPHDDNGEEADTSAGFGFGENMSISSAVDERGLQVELPITELHPGEIVLLPVWLRIPASTKPASKKLRLLFCYDIPSDIPLPDPKQRFRYLRYSTNINVKPLLKLSARCNHCVGYNDQHLVIMDISNLSSQKLAPTTVHILQVAIASDEWILEPLNQDGCMTSVSSEDNSTIVLKLVKNTAPKKQGSPNISIVSSSDQVHSLTASQLHFLCLENNQLILADRARARKIYETKKLELEQAGKLPVSVQEIRRLNQAQENGDTSGDNVLDKLWNGKARKDEPLPSSVDALIWNNRAELHLIVNWKLDSFTQDADQQPNRPVYGQNHIVQLYVRPKMTDLVNKRRNPLSLKMTYQPTVNYCFDESNKTCIVPVEIELMNIVWATSEAINFIFEAMMSKTHTHSFIYTGNTLKHVNNLLPDQSIKIKLNACFYAPGIFNLNTFGVSLTLPSSNNNKLKFIFPTQQLITINNNNDHEVQQVRQQVENPIAALDTSSLDDIEELEPKDSPHDMSDVDVTNIEPNPDDSGTNDADSQPKTDLLTDSMLEDGDQNETLQLLNDSSIIVDNSIADVLNSTEMLNDSGKSFKLEDEEMLFGSSNDAKTDVLPAELSVDPPSWPQKQNDDDNDTSDLNLNALNFTALSEEPKSPSASSQKTDDSFLRNLADELGVQEDDDEEHN